MTPIGAIRRGASLIVRPSPWVWGAIGVAAQISFSAGWVISETWQGPNYNPLNDTISDMQAANAPRVWFPIICFALGSVGTFGFAVFGLRPALSRAG